ncbi:restriction endonuclease subunit S [Salmonella enterica]|uniref:restriction endonuclease subunit S n=1 Tax=Salmonella TaxID=590 RepID=UPI00127C3386|nr:restriction endonuclease subunit S [Salmonella sp. SA14318]EDH8379136.1 restriction endonuclease [Salmonella enterica subsp. enterica serovar Apeyeme]EDH9166868.1 restriction endonuclease [Salmonella enterica subsp. enterica serovar Fallowfield]MCW6814271.1 restriction endonuclease subunit S [Salmonella enterica]MCW6833462.1 restriction endonuclease subunit S [Salmonella enterica subsp. arizonae]EDH9098749.1 restriction endonuclease [Salmonella enterica subsp. enterica serovar Apeyeme]
MSWPMVKLKDCCEVVGGATPKRNVAFYWDGDIPWITPKDVSNLSEPYIYEAPEYISKAGYKSAATYMLPVGTVLLTSRAPIGNVAIAGIELCTNQGFKSLIPGQNVHSKYLYHCIKKFVPQLELLGNGATFKEVSKRVVEDFEIPLPPLEEQKRIAAILDKADGVRQKREQAIKLADDFLRATFMKMFGTPAQNIHNFPKGTIRDLIDSVNYGTSAKASVGSGEYPVLRMGNITYQGGWDFTDFKYLDLSEKDKDKFLVQKGDLLFNRTNSKELVGKTAIYEEDRPMAFAGYLIRVRPNLNGNNYYLSGCLNSTYGKTTLVNMCKSIVGMANINAQELQDIEILIPPKHLQDEYENIYKKVKMGLSIFDRSAWQVQQLAANLMNKYFM